MNEQRTGLAPVVKEVIVARSREDAFRIFTEGLGSWWPTRQYSVSRKQIVSCGMETRLGGQIYEIREDGERFVWGTILGWAPPSRLEFTWHAGREPDTAQIVEVTFEKVEKGTRVRLEHRNWEVLGDRAEEIHAGYTSGWEHVFCHCYAAATQ